MAKIFYDIMPPRAIEIIPLSKANNVKTKQNTLKKSILRIVAFGLIIGISWAGFSSVPKTGAYLSDVEKSEINYIAAGGLDFQLSSTQVFSNMVLSPGTSATGTISIINLYNVPKYKVRADIFSGELCQHLNLEANLDGGSVEYSGPLNLFDFGPTVFDSPDDWFFTLTLPASTTESLIGETCNFNFVFYGSQIKNDLPFGIGFSDEEEATSSIKAKICFDSETRSCGYWKNHSSVYKPYLPQMLGNEVIDTIVKADNIFKNSCGDCGYSCSKTMRNKMKGQLLAMKFNVAHYGIGDYVPTSTASSVSQIIAAADDLLKATPTPPDSALEEMKNLLERLAQDLSIRVCTETGVKVLIPNGGEKWWVGKYYDLTWITKNIECPDDLIQINIWYSNDSGATWGNVIASTTNEGIYNWRIPLYLENNTYFIPSDKARIKVVAVCSQNLMVAGWDMSDYDFCPPIQEDLLTPEELELARSLGLIPQEIINEESTSTTEATSTEQVLISQELIEVSIYVEGVPGQETATLGAGQAIAPENSLTTEQVTTSTEEISTTTEEMASSTGDYSTSTESQGGGGIIDAIDGLIDDVVNEMVEVLTYDSTTTNANDNATTTEPKETTVIMQTPVISEQPAVIPENNPTESDSVNNSGDGTSE